jgi:hypothetical protein
VKRRLVRVVTLFVAASLLAALLTARTGGAQGQEPEWRSEFEAVCVKTDLAMNLPSAELTDLIARCDRLAPKIAAEGETVRKVYLRRLQSCRSLFAYVLESRAAAEAAGTPAAAGPATPAAEAPAAPPPTSSPATPETAPAVTPAPAPDATPEVAPEVTPAPPEAAPEDESGGEPEGGPDDDPDSDP